MQFCAVDAVGENRYNLVYAFWKANQRIIIAAIKSYKGTHLIQPTFSTGAVDTCIVVSRRSDGALRLTSLNGPKASARCSHEPINRPTTSSAFATRTISS